MLLLPVQVLVFAYCSHASFAGFAALLLRIESLLLYCLPANTFCPFAVLLHRQNKTGEAVACAVLQALTSGYQYHYADYLFAGKQ